MANTLKQQLIFVLALLSALFFSILLLPVLLVAILLFLIFTYWRIYRARHSEKPLPKGTIEILPKEEEPTKPLSTSNEELEISIDALQKKAKYEPNNDSFSNTSKDS